MINVHVFAVDYLVEYFENLVLWLVIKPVETHRDKVDRISFEIYVSFVLQKHLLINLFLVNISRFRAANFYDGTIKGFFYLKHLLNFHLMGLKWKLLQIQRKVFVVKQLRKQIDEGVTTVMLYLCHVEKNYLNALVVLSLDCQMKYCALFTFIFFIIDQVEILQLLKKVLIHFRKVLQDSLKFQVIIFDKFSIQEAVALVVNVVEWFNIENIIF